MERSASSVLSGQSSSVRDLPRPSATISVSSAVVTLNLRDNIAACMQRPGPQLSALDLKTAAFMPLLIASMSPLVWSQCLNVGSFYNQGQSQGHIHSHTYSPCFLFVMYTHQKQTRLIKVLYRKQTCRTEIHQDIIVKTMDTSTNGDKSSTSTHYQER